MAETLDLFPEELEIALKEKREKEQAKELAKEKSLINAQKRHAQKSPNAYRTISEVAAELDVATHVLRFWESKFSEIKPVKRAGGRRYFKPDDIDLLKRIQHLLYKEGYTIKGVQSLLKKVGVKELIAQDFSAAPESKPLTVVENDPVVAQASGSRTKEKVVLEELLVELKELKAFLDD